MEVELKYALLGGTHVFATTYTVLVNPRNSDIPKINNQMCIKKHTQLADVTIQNASTPTILVIIKMQGIFKKHIFCENLEFLTEMRTPPKPPKT